MKNKKSTGEPAPVSVSESRKRLLKATEIAANIGLVFVAVGLVSPIIGFEDVVWLLIFKWVFTVGAVIYFAARLAGAFGKEESFRVRRIRRMEVWAGVAFCVAAFFWFYNTAHIAQDTLRFMSFKMYQNTIVFTLVGAMIQIVASWMLNAAQRKESNNNNP